MSCHRSNLYYLSFSSNRLITSCHNYSLKVWLIVLKTYVSITQLQVPHMLFKCKPGISKVSLKQFVSKYKHSDGFLTMLDYSTNNIYQAILRQTWKDLFWPYFENIKNDGDDVTIDHCNCEKLLDKWTLKKGRLSALCHTGM